MLRIMKQLVSYAPPTWATNLANIPKYKLQLYQPMTPIQSWQTLPGLPEDIKLHIKRDDLTGIELSGNKIRKLEFLLADALSSGCKHVITCGGIQSNHCRATAAAARQTDLKPHLFLRTDIQSVEELEFRGNFLLNVMCGADVYFIDRYSKYERDIKGKMDKLAKDIKDSTGESSYLVPVGGSNAVGLFGYITAFEELIQQGVLERFDDIVLAIGSGGTAAGLAIGNYLTGSKVKLHAICVSDAADYFYDHISEMLLAVGITDVSSPHIIHVIEGYKGKGYGVSTQQEIDYIMSVSAQTGIITDPTYTGKAVHGLVQELTKNRHHFNGDRILFIHTGGIFGCLDDKLNTSILSSCSQSPAGTLVYKQSKIGFLK